MEINADGHTVAKWKKKLNKKFIATTTSIKKNNNEK